MAFQLFATGRETYDSVAMKLTQAGLVSTNMFSFTLRAWRGIILP